MSSGDVDFASNVTKRKFLYYSRIELHWTRREIPAATAEIFIEQLRCSAVKQRASFDAEYVGEVAIETKALKESFCLLSKI